MRKCPLHGVLSDGSVFAWGEEMWPSWNRFVEDGTVPQLVDLSSISKEDAKSVSNLSSGDGAIAWQQRKMVLLSRGGAVQMVV